MNQIWAPSTELLDDAAAAIDATACGDPESRFEQLAWSALLVQVGPVLLTRAFAPAHITASAAVLDPAGEQSCLVLHRKLGLWVQPGGHLEDGDRSVLGAAAREVEEETGLTGTVLPVPAQLSRHVAPCNPGIVDWHLDIRFLLLADLSTPRPSDETPDVRWFPVGSLPPGVAPGVAGLIAAAGRLLAGR